MDISLSDNQLIIWQNLKGGLKTMNIVYGFKISDKIDSLNIILLLYKRGVLLIQIIWICNQQIIKFTKAMECFDYTVKIYGKDQQQFELSFMIAPPISLIREDIESQYPKFIFIKNNGKQLFKGSQKRTQLKDIVHPNNVIIVKIQSESDNLQAIIEESSFKFRQKVIFTKQTKLSELRNIITIDQSLQTFYFLQSPENIQISKGSENNCYAQKIMREGKILIKFVQNSSSKTKEQKEKTKPKQLQAAMKSKNIVKGLLNELKQFQNQHRQENAHKNQAKIAKIGQVEQKLASLKIQHTFSKSTDIKDVIRQLVSIQEQSQTFIQHLQNAQRYTDQELITKFSNNICVGYFKQKVVSSNIFDLKNVKIFYDHSFNRLQQTYFTYSSDHQFKKHKAAIDTQLNGGSVAVTGGSPIFFIQGGVDIHMDRQQKNIKDVKEINSIFITQLYAVYIGLGVKFNEDNLIIRRQVIADYEELYKKSLQLKSKDFHEESVKFFSKYGVNIQQGTYYFGNKFSHSLRAQFHSYVSMAKKQTISLTQIDAQISGGGLFSGGFFAGKANFTHRGTQGQNLETQRKKQNYSVKNKTESYPPVRNIQMWKQIVALNNKYWNLLVKVTEKRSIWSFLRSTNSLKQSPYLSNLRLEAFNEFEKKLIKVIEALSPSDILEGQSSGFQEIVQPNLDLINQKLKQIGADQILKIIRIEIKQTSKDCTYFMRQTFSPQIQIDLGQFGTTLLNKEQLLHQLGVNNAFMKERCKFVAKKEYKFLELVEIFTEILKQFKNLRIFTFYITFPLMRFVSAMSLGFLLASMKLDEINIIVHPCHNEYQTKKNWTSELKCKDNKKPNIIYKNWN